MRKQVRRLGVRDGYDRWAATYDRTPNPVVWMDARHTLEALAPRAEERILDLGCGTGRHWTALERAGSRVVGLDFSRGMLSVARARHPCLPLVVADLEQPLPLRTACFDAVLCALVGEHLGTLAPVLREAYRVLRAGGRLVFSVYHPAMAAAGIEANFSDGEVEFRLGAIRHTVEVYLDALGVAGFADIDRREWRGDATLVAAVPAAARYLGFPVLLLLRGTK